MEQHTVKTESEVEEKRLPGTDWEPGPPSAPAQPAANIESGTSLSWRDHRRIVEDLSEQLAKNWSFKWQVCLVVIGLSTTLLGIVTLVVGGRIIDADVALAESRLNQHITDLAGRVDNSSKAVDTQLSQVHKRVEERITAEFQEKEIRNTVNSTAQAAAGRIISEQISPAEKVVEERLTSFKQFLDDRKAEYNSDLAAFRKELEVLKKRNSVTRLADQAIGAASSLDDYKSLAEMYDKESDPDLKAAENSEIYRVIDAYGMLAPSRIPNIELKAEVFNPEKKKENELNAEELLVALFNSAHEVRARAAFLLEKMPPTFHITESLAQAIESEHNLEALRYEKRAFAKATGYTEKGRIDGVDEIEWWKSHIDELRKRFAK